MHDLRAIRENPTDFDAAMARRGLEAQSPEILRLDEERRAVQTDLQDVQAERNEKSKSIGQIKAQGGDADAVMAEVGALKGRMGELEEQERALGEALSTVLAALPNVMFDDVPDGADEADNVEIRVWGEIKSQKGPDHVEIGEALGMMDFEAAAKMSGSRFTLLTGAMARMERALAQFFLDTHTQEHGYLETSPPLLVRDNALYGTGQLPKFSEDLFKTSKSGLEAQNELNKVINSKIDIRPKGDDTIDKANEKMAQEVAHKSYAKILEQYHYLIPTSEVPLTNIVAEEILEPDSLPRRYTAHTPCFRSEAGSAGRDTRGMLRQHQFYKVEMVSIVAPEESEAEHQRMTKCAEAVLKGLELPFRTVMLCSGDTGFGAKKTYDLEVWLPGQEAYREVSSVSNCGDFQARRMNARYKPDGEKKTQFVHTLNGSGVAVGRAMIAVMENYYDPADGGIFVPEVLKGYMGGCEKILKG